MLLLRYTQTVRANRDEHSLAGEKRDKQHGLYETSIQCETRLCPPLIRRGVWYEMASMSIRNFAVCKSARPIGARWQWSVRARCQAREFSHRMDRDWVRQAHETPVSVVIFGVSFIITVLIAVPETTYTLTHANWELYTTDLLWENLSLTLSLLARRQQLKSLSTVSTVRLCLIIYLFSLEILILLTSPLLISRIHS